jgi:hypothetical protein
MFLVVVTSSYWDISEGTRSTYPFSKQSFLPKCTPRHWHEIPWHTQARTGSWDNFSFSISALNLSSVISHCQHRPQCRHWSQLLAWHPASSPSSVLYFTQSDQPEIHISLGYSEASMLPFNKIKYKLLSKQTKRISLYGMKSTTSC